MAAQATLGAIHLTTTPRWYHCTRLWRWQPPPLTDFDFWYVSHGRGQLHFEDRVWEFGREQCLVLPPGTSVLGTQAPNDLLVIFAVHFVWDSFGNGESLQAPLHFPNAPIPVFEPSLFETMATEAERTAARGDELGRVQSTLWVQQMLLQAFEASALPRPSIVDQAIAEIVTLVRRFPEQQWEVQTLAARAHLSPSQFARRFRAATGKSPQQFLIKTRLERARQLLEETDMTQGHIAQDLGYTDLFFFSRQYKKWMGESPGTTRKKARHLISEM